MVCSNLPERLRNVPGLEMYDPDNMDLVITLDDQQLTALEHMPIEELIRNSFRGCYSWKEHREKPTKLDSYGKTLSDHAWEDMHKLIARALYRRGLK